jgi:hypothetical protein
MNDTQFGRCLKELSIALIAAKSPQAKGRVERLWGTLQSRLPVEFAISGITTIEAANDFLEQYIYAFNSSFAVEPEKAQSVFGKLHEGEELSHILCIKEKRCLDSGGVFSYGGKSFQIAPNANAPSLPTKSRIDVLLGASIGIKASYKNVVFDVLPFIPPSRRKKASTPPKQRQAVVPPPDHAWRVSLKTRGVPSWQYDGEDDDVYNETVRMLERTLLGNMR